MTIVQYRKIMASCFVLTHLPLTAVAFYVAMNGTAGHWVLLATTLVATIIAALGTLVVVRRFLAGTVTA